MLAIWRILSRLFGELNHSEVRAYQRPSKAAPIENRKRLTELNLLPDGLSTPSVITWIEQFAKVYAQKPKPEGRAVVVELDEMWHSLKKRPTRSGSGRLGIALRDGSSTGNWAVVTELPWSGS